VEEEIDGSVIVWASEPAY